MSSRCCTYSPVVREAVTFTVSSVAISTACFYRQPRRRSRAQALPAGPQSHLTNSSGNAE
eukprot:3772571-Pyramimonas_sp.AAC.1